MSSDTYYAIQDLMYRANNEPKRDFRIYQIYKQQIQQLNLTNKEFEEAIKQLCKRLKV